MRELADYDQADIVQSRRAFLREPGLYLRHVLE